jgi:hypothetical protein
MVLNALAIDPQRIWKGPWRWFSEELLDCCSPLEVLPTALQISGHPLQFVLKQHIITTAIIVIIVVLRWSRRTASPSPSSSASVSNPSFPQP